MKPTCAKQSKKNDSIKIRTTNAKTGDSFQLILDLGEPPRPDRPNPHFLTLFETGATHGSRIGINNNVLPSADNLLELLNELENCWKKGDFSVAAVALWVMPESGLFLSYCQNLNVAPDQHLLDILDRACELNRLYGPWRVILQLRAEFDSCYFESPGHLRNRLDCYKRWERFNLTESHFERYKKYGCRAVMANLTDEYPIKDLFTFLKRRKLRLADLPADVCCNRGFDIHHNFRWGWPCVSVENYCGTGWNSHLLIAYARGGAKEYKARWGCDYSPWGAVAGFIPAGTETMYHRDGRWLGGLSASHQLRGWMMGFLSGADYVEVEVADRTHFVLDHELVVPKDDFGGDVNKRIVRGKQDLSPAGVNGVAFGKYALERHPDRGQPYASMAVIVHSQNGWNAVGAGHAADVTPAGADPHISPYHVWWGRIESTPAEWMIGAFYRTAFEAEPIYAWLNRCWRDFEPPTGESMHNPATQNKRYELLVSGKVKVEEAEEGRYMGTTRWGDTMDVFDENVSGKILSDYPILGLLGIMPRTDSFWNTIKAYINNGGNVIVNVAQIPSKHQPFFGASWQSGNAGKGGLPTLAKFKPKDAHLWSSRNWMPQASVYETVRGSGRVYLTIKPWSVNSPQDFDHEVIRLVDELHAKLSPVKVVGGPVHWLANRLNNGWLVALFNHKGDTWRGEVSVAGCKPKAEWWEDTTVDSSDSQGALVATVPPYEFRILHFE